MLSQSARSFALSLPSHCTVREDASVVMIGAELSTIANVAWLVGVFCRQASIAVKVTSMLTHWPLRSPVGKSLDHIVTAPLQVSVAAA